MKCIDVIRSLDLKLRCQQDDSRENWLIKQVIPHHRANRGKPVILQYSQKVFRGRRTTCSLVVRRHQNTSGQASIEYSLWTKYTKMSITWPKVRWGLHQETHTLALRRTLRITSYQSQWWKCRVYRQLQDMAQLAAFRGKRCRDRKWKNSHRWSSVNPSG